MSLLAIVDGDHILRRGHPVRYHRSEEERIRLAVDQFVKFLFQARQMAAIDWRRPTRRIDRKPQSGGHANGVRALRSFEALDVHANPRQRRRIDRFQCESFAGSHRTSDIVLCRSAMQDTVLGNACRRTIREAVSKATTAASHQSSCRHEDHIGRQYHSTGLAQRSIHGAVEFADSNR